jgi:3-hydroxybutyrate dehydrogenase
VINDVLLAPQALKRLLEPAEVADAVAFLLGESGRAFTGAPLVLDGGWTAR